MLDYELKGNSQFFKQGSPVGFMPEFHPSNPGSTPIWGNSKNKKRNPNSLPKMIAV